MTLTWRYYNVNLDVKIVFKNNILINMAESQITVSRLFAQSFVQAQIKENIKTPRHWSLWEESTDGRWIPLTKRQ